MALNENREEGWQSKLVGLPPFDINVKNVFNEELPVAMRIIILPRICTKILARILSKFLQYCCKKRPGLKSEKSAILSALLTGWLEIG